MIEFITAELAAAGWLEDRVGLEMFSYRPNRGHSERFEAALVAAGATVVDGTDVLREMRRIKSSAELAYLREAGRFADIGMAAARGAIHPRHLALERRAHPQDTGLVEGTPDNLQAGRHRHPRERKLLEHRLTV